METSGVATSYDEKPRLDKPSYGIVGCAELKDLPHLVNLEVEHGYEPIGGPFFHDRTMAWCQTLWKRPALLQPLMKPIEPTKRR